MKSAGELGRPAPGHAPIELVAGPHDGERWHHAIEPTTMMPPKTIAHPARVAAGATITYVRRGGPERCEVDKLAVWHYDAQTPEVPA